MDASSGVVDGAVRESTDCDFGLGWTRLSRLRLYASACSFSRSFSLLFALLFNTSRNFEAEASSPSAIPVEVLSSTVLDLPKEDGLAAGGVVPANQEDDFRFSATSFSFASFHEERLKLDMELLIEAVGVEVPSAEAEVDGAAYLSLSNDFLLLRWRGAAPSSLPVETPAEIPASPTSSSSKASS